MPGPFATITMALPALTGQSREGETEMTASWVPVELAHHVYTEVVGFT